MQEHIV